MTIDLRCVPPSTTAQMKRVHVLHGKPVFFHGAAMRRETQTWSALLAPFVPDEPLDGPIALDIRLVYPHLKATKKADRDRVLPKVSGRYSTMTCSACGARSGPTGYAGLSVRRWTCGCGAEHDRDVNAAINTLNAARGLRVESGREVASGIATRVKRRRSQVRDLLRGAT